MQRLLSPAYWRSVLRWSADKEGGHSVRGALAWSSAQQYADFIMGLVAIIVLSRLLTPAQIGVYSVAMTFLGVVHMLRDLGTSDYLVQVETLDRETAATAFTVNLIIAWLLAGLLFVISPVLAAFFREPGLADVLRILTLTFLLLPIGATVNAILVREMQFGLRFRISFCQQLVQNSLTILLAALGFGYYSPAWGAVAGMATGVAGCFIWAGHYRIKGISLSQWRPVTRFGTQKTAETAMNQLGAAAPDFVIGRMLGMADVGLYSRGYGLVRMFRQNVMGVMATVSYATFARLHREGRDVSGPYLHSITLVTGLGWPFLGFASLMAAPIIRIFFGDQWTAAIPILRFAAIAGSISLIVIQFQNLLTAIGRVGTASLYTAFYQAVLIVMMIGAATIGLNAVAIGLIPVATLQAVLVSRLIVRLTSATPADYARALRPSLLITVAGLGAAWCVRQALPPGPDALWLPTLAAGLATLAISVSVGALIGHPLWLEIRPVLKNAFGRLSRRRAI